MNSLLKNFEKVGRYVTINISVCVEFSRLAFDTFYWIIVGPFKDKPIDRTRSFEQMVFMGIKSILIVFFVTFFTGVVLAMQSAYQLEKFGAVIYVASLVSVSLCRELGPVLTALVIAGRIGAAITAEIASMKVNEQIEALEAMAINPVRYLVVPKFVALFFMLPCLTILGNFSGILGGYLVGTLSLRLSGPLFIQTALKYLTLKDIYTGLSKSFVFAAVIALVGSYQGLKTSGGAVGVGRSTTLSVVVSFILIILVDCVLTGIYFFSNM
ncbi:MAG: ABC transporter permease [Candidatus Omnitrophota bacterium]